jgi:release factor glutamine methyltransferase
VRLKESLDAATARLTAEQVPSPRMNADLLLRFVLNCDRAYLFAHPERELTSNERSRYEAALAERGRGMPAQYITGHQEFWGMDLIVTQAVLIPRPETEHVIEAILERVGRALLPAKAAERRQNAAHGASRGSAAGSAPAPEGRKKILIADVGTGSGAIALALAKELPAAELHAVDISPAALEIARANAARHQLESRIHFHEGNLLEGFAPETFDFVVSNPPYVGESEEDTVQLEVRKFEPRNAVFAGPEGTEVIERLIPQAQGTLKPGGWLIMEISGTIAETVQKLLAGWEEVSLKPDLQSIPRVAIARKPQ